MAKDERIALWDNLKWILITLVVVGHFAGFYTDKSNICKSIFIFIYAFHMPAFIFISGVFHSNKNLTQKCIFYISVGFLLKILLFLVQTLEGGDRFELLSDNGIPWFMFVLAGYAVLGYILRNQNKVYILIASIMLACFIGYDASVGDFLYLSRGIVFFPFYMAGMIVKSRSIEVFKERSKWLIPVSLTIFAVWAYISFVQVDISYSLRPFFTGRRPFSDTSFMYELCPLIRLACYAITTFLGGALIVLTPSIRMPLITKMGSHSMDVYFWHWIALVIIEYFFHFKGLFNIGFMGKATYMLLAVVLSVILSQGYIFSFPLKQIKNAIYKPTERDNTVSGNCGFTENIDKDAIKSRGEY